MGSSLPRHGARVRTRHKDKNKKNKRKKPKADCKLVQKKYRKKIYMMHEQYKVMMHALMQREQVQTKVRITKLA